jgi:hypothetical protein
MPLRLLRSSFCNCPFRASSGCSGGLRHSARQGRNHRGMLDRHVSCRGAKSIKPERELLTTDCATACIDAQLQSVEIAKFRNRSGGAGRLAPLTAARHFPPALWYRVSLQLTGATQKCSVADIHCAMRGPRMKKAPHEAGLSWEEMNRPRKDSSALPESRPRCHDLLALHTSHRPADATMMRRTNASGRPGGTRPTAALNQSWVTRGTGGPG